MYSTDSSEIYYSVYISSNNSLITTNKLLLDLLVHVLPIHTLYVADN